MDPKTRRLMWLAGVGALVTIPPELMVLDVLTKRNMGVVARQWASGLSEHGFRNAVSNIQQYPLVYREALLARMDPAGRARVWRKAIIDYVGEHQELTAAQRGLLLRAEQLAVERNFAAPTSEVRDELRSIYDAVRLELGDDAANTLFSNLGPEPEPLHSALPPIAKFQDFLYRNYVVSALECNCFTNHPPDCPSGLDCTETIACEFSYFGCGIWYLEPCNGYCHE